MCEHEVHKDDKGPLSRNHNDFTCQYHLNASEYAGDFSAVSKDDIKVSPSCFYTFVSTDLEAKTSSGSKRKAPWEHDPATGKSSSLASSSLTIRERSENNNFAHALHGNGKGKSPYQYLPANLAKIAIDNEVSLRDAALLAKDELPRARFQPEISVSCKNATSINLPLQPKSSSETIRFSDFHSNMATETSAVSGSRMTSEDFRPTPPTTGTPSSAFAGVIHGKGVYSSGKNKMVSLKKNISPAIKPDNSTDQKVVNEPKSALDGEWTMVSDAVNSDAEDVATIRSLLDDSPEASDMGDASDSEWSVVDAGSVTS